MANGTTRNAISQLILKGKPATAEMQEEMDILARGRGQKIPLKAGASEHNHSNDTLQSSR